MAPKNAFYAQSGGVTSVINASAAGVIETARKYPKKIGKVFAGKNGILGALEENLIDTSYETSKQIELLKTSIYLLKYRFENISILVHYGRFVLRPTF